MNTFFPKDSWMMFIHKIRTARISNWMHVNIYFFALIIFHSVIYSVYGSTDSSSSGIDIAPDPTATAVVTPAPPVPSVNPSLDILINAFQSAGSQWQKTLSGVATNLFYILASIEIAWTGIRMTIRQADLSEWVSELVYQVIFIGFFYALLSNSADWANDIVQSFRTAGQEASAAGGGPNGGFSPSQIFMYGYQIANIIILDMPFVKDGDAFFLVSSSLIILSCAALISASMVLVLVETYLAVYAGIIFMGFGGSRFTSQIAIKTLMYTFAAGAKLFFIQLLAGLTENQIALLLQELQGFTTVSNTIIFKIIGIFIVLVIIIKRAPEILQSMLNGINFNFNFSPPVTDTNANVPATPLASTNTITALKSSEASAPSGYAPSMAGMFNTSDDKIPTENIGSRLLDVENTAFHTSAFSESGSINTSVPAFDVSPRIVSTSTPSTNDVSNAAITTTGITTIPASMIASESTPVNQANVQNGGTLDDAVNTQTSVSSTGQGNNQRSDSTVDSQSSQQSAAEYQPLGLGGRFGSDSGSAASATSPLNQANQPNQANNDISNATSALSGQQQTTDVISNNTGMPNTSEQPGNQSEQNISSAASALSGQQQANNVIDTNISTPGSSGQPNNQSTESISSTTSALGGQQDSNQKQTGTIDSNQKNSAASGNNESKDMGGKLAPDLPNAKTVASANTVPGNAGSTSQPSVSPSPSTPANPVSNPSASTAPTATATPTSAASASTASTATAAPTSAASTSTAPTATATPTSAASASTAPAATAAPTSAASTSTAPTATAAPTSAASTSTAPTATAAPTSAASTSTAPTATAPAATPANTPANSKTAGASGEDKDSEDKKADGKSKKASSDVDDKNKADDKVNKAKKYDQDEKDKKRKPEDPNKNDDSFDDKPKKPHSPKNDQHDK